MLQRNSKPNPTEKKHQQTKQNNNNQTTTTTKYTPTAKATEAMLSFTIFVE